MTKALSSMYAQHKQQEHKPICRRPDTCHVDKIDNAANCAELIDSENKSCLLIKHSAGWQNDRCENWLQQNNFSTLTHVSHEGKTLPDIRRFNYVLIYGGEPCVNDQNYKKYLEPELQLIEAALKHDIPCLGICLGAQMIAHVLGANVKPLPCGTTEFGFSLITPTPDALDFMPQPFHMLQWHCEGFDLPTDCTLLATGGLFPNQAFQYGSNTFGVQFHPEVTTEVLRYWHQRKLDSRRYGEQRRTEQLQDCIRYARDTDNWCNRFMHHWVSA